MRPLRRAGVLAAALALAGSTPATAAGHWVGVWAASPSDVDERGFEDQSLRLIVTPTAGGRRVRVRLSNRFGDTRVTFSSASIARREAGASVEAHSMRRLRFAGRRRVTLAPGADVVSDQVGLRVEPFQDLAVSLHVRGASGPATRHMIALQTSYASPPGAGPHATDRAGTAFTLALDARPYVTDVEVRAPARVAAVVTLGDSITDGVGSDLDASDRYPDLLARRLAGAGLPLAVQNAGIGGTRLLDDDPVFGPSLLGRLQADAIDQHGARVVIVLVGTNDLTTRPDGADAVIDGLRAVVSTAHAAGLAVLLGTQTPAKDTPLTAHGAPATIVARNRVNHWIRTSGVADGVVDFHAAVRDPADPDRLRPEYDCGDHIHPNAAGYAAMAQAVDLEQLRALTSAHRSGGTTR